MLLKFVALLGLFVSLTSLSLITFLRAMQSVSDIGLIAVIQPLFDPIRGSVDIVLVDINTQQILNITRRQGHYTKPALSEDGRVAFVSSDEHDFEIYVYDLSTQEMRQVTDNQVHDTS